MIEGTSVDPPGRKINPSTYLKKGEGDSGKMKKKKT